MRSAIWLFLLLPAGSVAAQDYKGTHSQELCVVYAVSLVRGTPAAPGLVDELRSRGETCAPSSTYIQAAEARIRREDYEAHRQEVGRQNAQARADAARDERIRDAGRALLLLQQQRDQERRSNAPVRTRCMPNYIGGVDCTTN